MRATGIRAGQRLAGLLALAALATGCSGAGEPGQQASTDLPSASSTSAEATPDLPELGPPDLPMPAEARTQDEAGAEAFLRYYMDVYNHAQRTMDSTYMRDLSDGCVTCDGIADDLDTDAATGYSYEGGQVSVDGMSEAFVEGDEAQLAFSLTQAPLVVLSAGEPVEGLTFPETSTQGNGAILSWDESQQTWIFTQWDVTA